MEIPRGAGSGFVWDAEAGLVVTNYHVVAGADRLAITLADEQAFQAEVVGLAPERSGGTPLDGSARRPDRAAAGNSSELSVGRKVMAIGNPFGLDTTLTVGVVSALDRKYSLPATAPSAGSFRRTRRSTPVTQRAAAEFSRTIGRCEYRHLFAEWGSAGIGFAIPVNTVIEVVPQ